MGQQFSKDVAKLLAQIFVFNPDGRPSFSYLFSIPLFKKYENHNVLSQYSQAYQEIERSVSVHEEK